MNKQISDAAWGNLQEPKIEYDWTTPDVENLFGDRNGF